MRSLVILFLRFIRFQVYAIYEYTPNEMRIDVYRYAYILQVVEIRA